MTHWQITQLGLEINFTVFNYSSFCPNGSYWLSSLTFSLFPVVIRGFSSPCKFSKLGFHHLGVTELLLGLAEISDRTSFIYELSISFIPIVSIIVPCWLKSGVFLKLIVYRHHLHLLILSLLRLLFPLWKLYKITSKIVEPFYRVPAFQWTPHILLFLSSSNTKYISFTFGLFLQAHIFKPRYFLREMLFGVLISLKDILCCFNILFLIGQLFILDISYLQKNWEVSVMNIPYMSLGDSLIVNILPYFLFLYV